MPPSFMKLRSLNFSANSEDDLDLSQVDAAVAPVSSTFMWGLVGSDEWAPLHETGPAPAQEVRPEVPVEVLHPTVWSLAAQGAEGSSESFESFDLPNPPDLVGEPLWTESWSQAGVSSRSLPAMISGETAADLAQRDQAFQETYREVEHGTKPVVPPSDLFLVDGQGCSQGSLADNVSLVGSVRQEGPDVSLLSANGWI